MSEIPAPIADRISEWRRILTTVPLSARMPVFQDAANDLAGMLPRGLVKTDAVDALLDMAQSNGLIANGLDDVQIIMSDAFAKADEQQTEFVPWNDYDRHREQHEQPQQVKAKRSNGHGQARPVLMTKAEFIKGFTPPDFLIAGILQRRFVYSLTGQTGHAKSAIALLIAELVSSPDRNSILGRHKVHKGRVVYFVGENPDDIRMRVIGADSRRSDNPLDDSIIFVPGVFDIAGMFSVLEFELRDRPVDLVIVDTSAAYFLGQDENANPQIGGHARMLRSLTRLPGGPCVLVLCHPIKYVQDPSQLLPRGGGAFLAEVDGNLTAWKHDEILIELHYNKIRGPGFEPLSFKLEQIRTPQLHDTGGDMISTVRAVAISQSDEDSQSNRTRDDDDRALAAMLENPDVSIAGIAERWGWTFQDGAPAKSRAQRALDRLAKSNPRLVGNDRGRWFLTEKGKEAARKAALRFLAEAESTLQSRLEFH